MKFLSTLFILVSLSSLFGLSSETAALNTRAVKGRILLDVENHGEAWYVLPTSYERVFLGRPNDALQVMRSEGLGIRSSELSSIPLALSALEGDDTDQDGLIDSFEEAIGTDPDSTDTDGDGFPDREEIASQHSPVDPSRVIVNEELVNRLKGHILIQIENAGQAWYVNPLDGRRSYLGRPHDAFRIMRELSLGISHGHLLQIPLRGSGKLGSETKREEEKIKPINIEINARDFSFIPYSTKVEAGKPLRVLFKNNGKTPHNLTIEELGRATPTMIPGESASLQLESTEPGIYTFFCSLPDHRKRGMEAFFRAL